MYQWTPELIVKLRESMTRRLSDDELRRICFDLRKKYSDLRDLDFESLTGIKNSKIVELITYCERRDRIPALFGECWEVCPSIHNDVLGTPPPDSDGASRENDPTKPRRSRSSVSIGCIIAIVGIVAAGLGIAFGYLVLTKIIPLPCPSCAGLVIGRGYGCPANMEAVGPGVSDRSCKDTFTLPSPTTTTQIRIEMMERASKEFGYSLYEVEAYGPGDPARNLLKGGAVTVSSTEDARYIASNATDGDRTSRWGSQLRQDSQWLEITLPQPVRIDRIELRWENAYAAEYCVIVKPAQ